ncbi:OmpA-OmpF porin, OOP family [Roseovarius azorensis]|uniref:OmpA-OmpF porin, OOP family n=1 Tax=Roseovarius azorensis TaxID=1287727 RepID=A0A1H7UHK4_9RHOB|nr:OmpA family protein [Roseovarius azorensis]SEL96266.1 OmpA-OmpF porin, OOP family [Roseovarius azorensis]
MRLSSVFTIAATFLGAAVTCVVAAGFAVSAIEDGSRHAVRDRLDGEGMHWAEVHTDGLQVFLAGTAPTEAKRFKALSLAGTVVDAARVIDQMLVEDAADIAPPKFAIEILRNESGISLIGLVPAATDREQLLADIGSATNDAAVADLLDAADYPTPETWPDALLYAVRALGQLPRSKISVSAERVEITTMVDSVEAQRRIETDLARRAPENVRLALNISAPRPVITPFTLRFVIDEGGARFDACSADTEEARERILRAAGQAGMQARADCVVGMGVPSPHWAQAAELAIAAVAELGGGNVTFADADVALWAPHGTGQRVFDDVVGRLEADLPEVFSLSATLPPPPADAAPVVPEFIATLSPEGQVLLRGRVGSEQTRTTVASFAKARFASDAVHVTARVAEGLPGDWPMRVLLGVEALSYLSSGVVTVTPDRLSVEGNTGRERASSEIAQFLADKLGGAEQFAINVAYKEQLDPVASVPTPEECVARIAEVQSGRKINFEPGSATIDGQGAEIMDDIADILRECGEIRMEIGGHTDSQGREEMNAQLSLDRARTVLNELRLRRVLTSALEARGYGESQPIADNDTEEGRETNRRIEFRLIRPEPVAEKETGLESLEEQVEEGTEQSEDAQDQTTNEQN